MVLRFLVLTVIIFAVSAASADGADVKTFHLKSATVNGDGSETAPFGTFAAVQEAVRKAVADNSLPSGKVTVVVHDGTYRIGKAIAFGKADSGTAAHPVVWRAATKGKVRLTGGIPAPKFSPLAESDPNWRRIQKRVRKNILVANLKASGISDYGEVRTRGFGGPYMELVCGGGFQTLARWPNDSYTEIADAEPMLDADKKRVFSRAFKYSDERLDYWADEPDICMNGFFAYWWASDRAAVGSIDPDTNTIRQKGGGEDRYKNPETGSRYGYKKGMPWHGYNILRELDAPGEYYIDRTLGRLYFWPPEGKNVADGELTFADGLVLLEGASNITLSGFTMENCRDLALAVRNCDAVNVSACVIRNSGGRGVVMEGGRNCRIVGCDVEWCNDGGIVVTGGVPETLTHGNLVVENCHIHHYALMGLTYCAAIDVTGCGIAVRHNTIHDGPHVGIIFRKPSRECEVSWNEIHSVCLESGEMGAFYAGRDWTMCGNRIESNWFHDIYNQRPQPNHAIMLDDGGAGFTITSNWFVRIASGVSLSGIGNTVDNNVFIDCPVPVTAWGAWKDAGDLSNPRCFTHQTILDRLSAVPVHEEPWKSRYPYLALLDDAIKNNAVRSPLTRTSIRKNIYANAKFAPVLYYAGNLFDGLYSPVAWLVEDNVEAGHPEPAGFGALPPLYKIGVQHTPDRATWPVMHSVTMKSNGLKPVYHWLK